MLQSVLIIFLVVQGVIFSGCRKERLEAEVPIVSEENRFRQMGFRQAEGDIAEGKYLY